MYSNFDFLEERFSVLATFGRQAEQYCYSDANSCLMKLGMIGETIVNLMYAYDNIPFPQENTAAMRIDVLLREEMLDRSLADILHVLRKVRNKAVHENYASVEKARVLLPMAYSLCEWFMETYGDWNYQHKDYVPVDAGAAAVAGSAKPSPTELDEILMQSAEVIAEKAVPVGADARRKQARTAAGYRYISEEETRYMIDEQLRKVGWEADSQELRYAKGTRPKKGHNMVIAEWPVQLPGGRTGHADYAVFIGLKMVAIIEAKAMHKDIPSVLDYQGKAYPKGIREADAIYQAGQWGAYKVPFTFATNGRPYLEQYQTKSGVWFLDLRDSSNVPKALHGWMSPRGMEEILHRDTEKANSSLNRLSYNVLKDPAGLGLRYYQIDAVRAAEQAVIRGQDHVLLAMATGTGKTRTILGLMYRFLVTKRFSHILFLVDRNALGTQALETFRNAKLEQMQTLDNLYNIKELKDKKPDKETKVQIATVQSMIKRILYNDDDVMPAITDYDLVIIDEAHRGYILDKEMSDDEELYRSQDEYQSKYRAVVDYFDAVKIAMTATPALHTTQIFGLPVYTYTYRQAVIDGYLVDHDAPHRLKTKLSQEGIHYNKGDVVAMYDPDTGELLNGASLADEVDYDVEDFNRKVITESFNRIVLEEIAEELDPSDPQKGKTLIYAANDQHADLIVQILRQIYEGVLDNQAILKITGQAGGGNRKYIEDAIRRFKNERYPNIVVTVDLLTTGIDVPEITTLVFLRRVKSRILFEQMLGRATRLCPDIHKDHFEIYDAVGVYDCLEDVTSMKPIVVDPSVTYAQLLEGLESLEEEGKVKQLVGQILAKAQRSLRRMSGDDRKHADTLCGQSIKTWLEDLKGRTPADCRNRILEQKDLFNMLVDCKGMERKRYIIVSDVPDTLIEHKRDYGSSEEKEKVTRPEDYLEAFSAYINHNINEIAALNILCTRPKELKREELRQLEHILMANGFSVTQLNTAVSEMTNEKMAADIISFIRRSALGSTLLSHEARIRRAVERLKRAHHFTAGQLAWLRTIEAYLMKESVITTDTFNTDSRFKSKGGFAKLNKNVFDNKLEYIIDELNTYLYDDGGKLG